MDLAMDECSSRRSIAARRACLTASRNLSIARHMARSGNISLERAVDTLSSGQTGSAQHMTWPGDIGSQRANDTHRACNFHTSASRYLCESSLQAPIVLMNATAASEMLGSRSVYFVGDSLSSQHFHAFACELHMDREVQAHSTQDLSTVGLQATCAMRRSNQPGRLCHISAGNGLQEASSAAVCRILSTSGTLRKGDVVVANEGVWRRAFDGDGAVHELQRVGEFADPGSCVGILRSLGVRLLWRETAAQHFDRTLTGQYKPGCKIARCGRCGRIMNTTSLLVLNAAVTSRMQSLGVPVLPFFAPTLPLWDAHVARLSLSVRQAQILDCTHWCEPNAIFTAMSPVLLQSQR